MFRITVPCIAVVIVICCMKVPLPLFFLTLRGFYRYNVRGREGEHFVDLP